MGILKGRLGLETARIPHGDRHGLISLSRGNLSVEDGTLRFVTAGSEDLAPGDYAIPFQNISNILLGPGSTVTHDALRIMARNGTGLIAVGENGVRFYASMPFGPDDSALARKQILAWADADGQRINIARKMYAWRLGEVLPHSEISVLRGIEGARMKSLYIALAQQYEIQWKGRKYDRKSPESADLPNQAINHAATAVEAAATIAVASTGTLPQIGFIHEHSGNAFCLDIADLFRDSVTIPTAFAAVTEFKKKNLPNIEYAVRMKTGKTLRDKQIISQMIERIKELFNGHDGNRHS